MGGVDGGVVGTEAANMKSSCQSMELNPELEPKGDEATVVVWS